VRFSTLVAALCLASATAAAQPHSAAKDPPPTLSITDSTGNPIGTLVAESVPCIALQLQTGICPVGELAAISLRGQVVGVAVTADGFVNTPVGALAFYHTTANCTGQRYFAATAEPGAPTLLYLAVAEVDTLYFASTPIQNMVLHSAENFSASNSLASPQCFSFGNNPPTLAVGPLDAADLSTLGTPPFSLH
jgi:hypothetical protein